MMECLPWDENYVDIGRIDICCHLSEIDEEYFAFECKRFVKENMTRSHFKAEYYEKGIKRFE